MRRNVSDDGDVFKEIKLLMHSSRGKHGYVTVTNMSYAKQIILAKFQNHFVVQLFKYPKTKKNFLTDTNSFWELGSQFPALVSPCQC